MSFATSWKSSTKRSKQRKYQFNAPAHIKSKFLAAKLSNELRKKHNTRNVRVRKGDKVKVLRGQFKGTIGAVESVNVAMTRIFIPKVEVVKKDGAKVKYPVHPSNVEIVEIKSDKRRFKDASASTKKAKPAAKPAQNAEKKVEAKPAAEEKNG